MRGEDSALPGWGWEQKQTDIYTVSAPMMSNNTITRAAD